MLSNHVHASCIHSTCWILGNMARQHHSNDITDSAEQFSDALPFSYSHLSVKCRRKVLVGMFGETEDLSCPANCCDVTTCYDCCMITCNNHNMCNPF